MAAVSMKLAAAAFVCLHFGCSDPASTVTAEDPKSAPVEDWSRFRGPNGSGVAAATGLPTEWSATKNVLWKTALPGPGSSSPIVVGRHIFVACYSGYGLSKHDPGDPQNLRRHIVCVHAESGNIVWDKLVSSERRDHGYTGFIQLHGYASSTPTSDGQRVYVYFGPWGAFAFDLQGNQLWHTDCGQRTHGFGSGASPILHGDLLLVNASVESNSLIALDKRTGKVAWRASNVRDAWNTPILVESTGKTQVVVATLPGIQAFAADTGALLWQYNGAKQNTYICPSLVSNGDVIYGMSSYSGPVVAVRANGDEVWKSDSRFNTTVVSPVYHAGHIYYPHDNEDRIACIDARTGKMKKLHSLQGPKPIYASPLIADGKLFVVTRTQGALVFNATPELERIAHNMLEGDDSQFHGSAVPVGRDLLLRSEKYLYRIGSR